MDRLNTFLNVITQPNMWYNFDTKETLTNTELQQKVNNGEISLDKISSDNEIPVYGDVERAYKYWIPYMDVVLKTRNNINLGFGRIRVRQTPPRGVQGAGYVDVPGWEKISAYSNGAHMWRPLSPFYIGPVEYIKDGEQKQALIFENFWQGHKVWQNVEKQNKKNWKWPAEIHVDGVIKPHTPLSELPAPNNKWYAWHNALMKHTQSVRRPNGRNIPLYAWWQGRKLDTVASRKEIYIPYLQKLYRQHPAYKQLLEKVRNGKNITILEPDGPSFQLYPSGMEVTLDLLYDLQNVTKMKDFPGGKGDKYVPYGHGYVIALTIFEDLYGY